jgi:hypothetical protein
MIGPCEAGDSARSVELARELEPAWEVVERKVVGLIGEERQRALIDLVHASVAANVCPGFQLDADRFTRSFGLVENALKQDRPEPEHRSAEHQLLIHYGTFLGLLTAEALLVRDAFCASVNGSKAFADGIVRSAKPR